MQMIGQDHDGVDTERVLLFHALERGTQAIYVVGIREVVPTFVGGQREEETASGNKCPAIVAHGLYWWNRC